MYQIYSQLRASKLEVQGLLEWILCYRIYRAYPKQLRDAVPNRRVPGVTAGGPAHHHVQVCHRQGRALKLLLQLAQDCDSTGHLSMTKSTDFGGRRDEPSTCHNAPGGV
jgi:hypothetical protein